MISACDNCKKIEVRTSKLRKIWNLSPSSGYGELGSLHFLVHPNIAWCPVGRCTALLARSGMKMGIGISIASET